MGPLQLLFGRLRLALYMSVQKREEHSLNASWECTIIRPALLALSKLPQFWMAMLEWMRYRSCILWKIIHLEAIDSLLPQIFPLDGAWFHPFCLHFIISCLYLNELYQSFFRCFLCTCHFWNCFTKASSRVIPSTGSGSWRRWSCDGFSNFYLFLSVT